MNRSEENTGRGQNTPENDPSKAMDSKKEVEQSNDAKIDQDFPGYPHYPAKEDIMDQRTDSHRVDADVENLPSGPNGTGVSQRYLVQQDSDRTRQENLGSGADQEGFEGDDALAATNSRDEEIGIPQNIDHDDLKNRQGIAGSDLEQDEPNDR
jgi:hypothetical protein